MKTAIREKVRTPAGPPAAEDLSLLKDPRRSPSRQWLAASGLPESQMDRPFIGVFTCTSDILGPSPHIEALLQSVDKGIQQAGGVPFRFQLSALVESLAQGHEGLSYLFPRRSVLADDVE